ncbi:MAG: hypothetical protein AAGA75_09685 [Cyanobacteria bacterium P01_E01_bin.6]
MQTDRSNKIDLSADYPCPCRRQGRLIPITLTEAFGCSRCQQIFAVQDSGYTIEQLSTAYPYKKIWRWTGRQWSTLRPPIGQNFLPLVLLAIVGLIAILFLKPLLSSIELLEITGFQIIAAVILISLVSIIFWLAYRR